MPKYNLYITLFFTGLFLTSCRSYYIPVDNFKKMFEGMDTSNLTKAVSYNGPANIKVNYLTYPIEIIKAVDNKGNPVDIKSTPTLEVEIVYSAYEKSVFQFQQIRVQGDYVIGVNSTQKQEFMNINSPIYKRDTLNTGADRNNFRLYDYSNSKQENTQQGIPFSSIRKITVVKQ